MQSHALLDSEDGLILLNYAARLMAVDLEREALLERAAESLSDFSANKSVALFTWKDGERRICLEGLFKDRRYQAVHKEIPLAETPLEEIIINREFAVFPNRKGFDTPMPAGKGQEGEGWCLCLPLVGAATKMIGVIAIMVPGGRPRPTKELQLLHILTTVIAISLENSVLFQMATRDGLTGLYIRNIFEIRLREELARVRRHGGVFSILMTDIDHFKGINDTHGHESGDQALKEIAAIFRKHVRGDLDLVCRYGGDEFMTLMANTGAREAMKIADRIHERCRGNTLTIPGAALTITLSSGLLTVGGGREWKERELISRVDQLLYQAKGRGGNNICADGL